MVVDIIFGFLGSGKTTFITRMLQEWGSLEKIVVLVNEFGEVGIDGELLKGSGGEVVEMPSGCICCTLQSDFRSQLLDIIHHIHPERVVIEPTGVATIAQIQSIVRAELFEEAIESIHPVMIADAVGFMGFYKVNRHFVESQVRHARLVLLNKCDRVNKTKAMLIRDAVHAINPEIKVLMTQFGAVDWAEYKKALSIPFPATEWMREEKLRKEGAGSEPFFNLREEGGSSSHLLEEEDALGFESFGGVYPDLSFERGALEALFQELNSTESGMGEIVRAKGVFEVEEGWVLMELASGEVSTRPVLPSSETKVSIIGKRLDRERIGAAIERCASVDPSDR